jgi:hypothetical protein
MAFKFAGFEKVPFTTDEVIADGSDEAWDRLVHLYVEDNPLSVEDGCRLSINLQAELAALALSRQVQPSVS